MLDLHNLRVVRQQRTICRVPRLQLATGERVVVVGANGSGKTTLLKIVAGLVQDFLGRVDVSVPRQERVYVHQSPYLFRGTVLSNVAYGPAARGLSRGEQHQQATEWLARFQIDHLLARTTDRLSGGERKRVALARAFAARPQLLLLDEPFAELDPAGSELVAEILRHEPSLTILIASPTSLLETIGARQLMLSGALGDASGDGRP